MDSFRINRMKNQKSLELKKISKVCLSTRLSQEKSYPVGKNKPNKSFNTLSKNKNEIHNKHFDIKMIQNIESPRKYYSGIVFNEIKNQKNIKLCSTSNVFVFKKTNKNNCSQNTKINPQVFNFQIKDSQNPYLVTKQIHQKRNIKTTQLNLNSCSSFIKQADSPTIRRRLLRTHHGIKNSLNQYPLKRRSSIQDNLTQQTIHNKFEPSPWDLKNHNQDITIYLLSDLNFDKDNQCIQFVI